MLKCMPTETQAVKRRTAIPMSMRLSLILVLVIELLVILEELNPFGRTR